jgi:hypothetical protein
VCVCVCLGAFVSAVCVPCVCGVFSQQHGYHCPHQGISIIFVASHTKFCCVDVVVVSHLCDLIGKASVSLIGYI